MSQDLTKIDKKINDFFNSTLEREILEYFDYEGGWTVLSLQDNREYHWSEDGNSVEFGEEPFERYEGMYSCAIIGDVIRKGKYALIPIDTQCDGNKYLGLFLLEKEIAQEE